MKEWHRAWAHLPCKTAGTASMLTFAFAAPPHSTEFLARSDKQIAFCPGQETEDKHTTAAACYAYLVFAYVSYALGPAESLLVASCQFAGRPCQKGECPCNTAGTAHPSLFAIRFTLDR